DIVERDLPAVAELPVERVARLRGPLHVDLGREEEVRNGAEGRGEPLGDRLADLGEGDVLVRGPLHRRRGRPAPSPLCRSRPRRASPPSSPRRLPAYAISPGALPPWSGRALP